MKMSKAGSKVWRALHSSRSTNPEIIAKASGIKSAEMIRGIENLLKIGGLIMTEEDGSYIETRSTEFSIEAKRAMR